jgi:D-psicose/D-tagatose/L-ribulose 3-epimerase
MIREAGMSENKFNFPLAVQLLLAGDYLEQEETRRLFALLTELGFSGVELNFPAPAEIDPEELTELLAGFGLRCSMFATGFTAKSEKLSLSSADEHVRLRSVKRCLDFIDFAARLDAGVIVGFLKGGPAPSATERETARLCFADSLARIAPRAAEREVPLLIEATNRYESAVANSLEETAALVKPYADGGMRILPDTFHMNIEETDPLAALERFAPLFDSLHISDNNRFFPGLGAIDFSRYLDWLKNSGYRGGLAIEGNLKQDLQSDLRASLSYLAPLLR